MSSIHQAFETINIKSYEDVLILRDWLLDYDWQEGEKLTNALNDIEDTFWFHYLKGRFISIKNHELRKLAIENAITGDPSHYAYWSARHHGL